ncbi:MAG: hypothetical protein RR328_02855 [Bacteroidales bacterium]
MIKKISLFCILTICIEFVNAANTNNAYNLRKMEIAFQGGVANPVGNFAKEGFSSFNEQTGELSYNGAQAGFTYGLSLSFYPSDYFGAVILFNGVSYKFKGKTFSGINTNDHRIWNTTFTDKWTSFAAQVGATFRYPLLDWLQITSRATIGYAHLMSPYYKSEAQDKRILWTREVHSKSAPAFGMAFGIGFKWLISPGFHLNLTGDYFTATPFKFKNVESTLNTKSTSLTGDAGPNIEVSRVKYHTTQNFSSLNISLGISFAF